MPALEVIIGLEVHAQMNTKTKMFCGCDNDAFGKEPNTTVCPICMGHPGTLPVQNQEVIAKAVKASLAIGCTVNASSHFDRKHYFYPDLPAGFQISQYDFPLSSKGEVTYELNGGEKVCRITRLHMENDAGKLTHRGDRTLCDYNRAGTPLMEIVTEPDLRSAEEAVAFAEGLRRILIAIAASDAQSALEAKKIINEKLAAMDAKLKTMDTKLDNIASAVTYDGAGVAVMVNAHHNWVEQNLTRRTDLADLAQKGEVSSLTTIVKQRTSRRYLTAIVGSQLAKPVTVVVRPASQTPTIVSTSE